MSRAVRAQQAKDALTGADQAVARDHTSNPTGHHLPPGKDDILLLKRQHNGFSCA